MKTLISLFAAAAMILPVAASAATISNPLFSTGQTSIDAAGGSTVSGTFTLTVGAGEVVEFLRTQSDPSQPFVDTSVGGALGYQEQVYTNVPFSVKVPPNTGTFFPTVQGAGIFGGGRSINGGDSVNFGPTGLGTVRVTANNSTSSSEPSVGSEDFWTKLMAMLTAALKPATPAPTINPNCPVMVYNGANAYAVQDWLMNHGQSGPFAAKGVYKATGFWGTASAAAYTNATLACAH